MSHFNKLNRKFWIIGSFLLIVIIVIFVIIPVLSSQKNSSLMEAIEQGNEQEVKQLLDAGADANAKGWPSHKTGISYLLDRSTHAEYYQRTALMLAACNDSSKIVELLLEHKANVDDDVYNHSMYALECAASSAKPANVILLLAHGAGRDPKKLTWALLNAISAFSAMHSDESQYKECILLLIQRGADINGTDPYGNYAMTSAVQSGGNKDAIDFLLKQGANPNVTDRNGSTPLKLAKDRNESTLVKCLKDAGAKQ